MKEQQYREGKEARKSFDDAMKALFQAPKTISISQPKKKKRPKKAASHKPGTGG